MFRHGAMLGNIRFLSSITLSGNNFQKISLLCKFANLRIPSATTFTQLQSHYLVPTIDAYWTNVKEIAQEELRAINVIIAGDGRMDSPGHCAKYCTYTVMDQSSKKILAMEVVDKRETALISARMEAIGFQRALRELKSAGMSIVEVVTDAHPQISSIMKKNYNDIRHSWDIWHGAKNLGKKLCAASQERGKGALKPWISSITNQFYHAAENCDRDSLKLTIKLTSVINHCTNRHEWALGQCDHGEVEEDPKKPWLDPCGLATESLEKILTDRRFQNTLKHYVTCQTTSELESLNNHLLMYAAKRQAFLYAVYKCRCQLAAIDYMEHINRPYKQNRKGENYYNQTYSKATNNWTVKPVKQEKHYIYMNSTLKSIRQSYCSGEAKISHRVRELEADPGKTPPTTKELLERQHQRISKYPRPGSSKDPF